MTKAGGHQLFGFIISLLSVAGVLAYLLAAETPRGDISGTVVAEERGVALPEAEVSLVPVGGGPARQMKADAQGQFEFRRIPAGSYKVSAQSVAHKQQARTVQVPEGRVVSVVLELAPVDPFLDLYLHQRVFTPGEQPELRCRGFGPAARVTVEVYRVDFATAVAARSRSLSDLFSPYGGSIEKLDLRQVPQLEPVAAIDQRITTRDAEGVFNERVRLRELSAGVYLVAVSDDELRRVELITVTDLGVVTKRTPEQLLVYAVDLESGRPRPGVQIQTSWDGKPAGEGLTDDDGLLELSLPLRRGSGPLEVSARAGESFAFVDSWRWYSPDHEGWCVYTYTDRPAYRPGQTVYFKSIARQLVDKEYQVPQRVSAAVLVRDDKDNLIYSGQHETNDFGSLDGKFELAESALPGLYSVAVSIAGETIYSDFEVLEYRKPEYEVSVETEKGRYVRGDTIKATVKAEYYYGAPVAGAQVAYEVTCSEYWSFPGQQDWDEDIYETYAYGGDGEIVVEGTGTTNRAGELAIEVPPGRAADEDDDGVRDKRYTISAEVTDPSRRAVSGSASVIVTQGEYYIQLQSSPSVLGPDEPVAVKITAVDYDGEPVAGASGYAALQRSEWRGNSESLEQEASAQWTADAHGVAQVSFTPRRKARYRVQVVAEDDRGNKIRARDWLWVTEGRYASFSYPYGELELKADKPTYQVGDVAHILVNSEYAPATALLTVEGSDIYRHRLVELSGKSTIVDVEVREEYMPGCYVSVAFVRNKKFFSERTGLNISRQTKALQVTITPDRQEYRPRQPARYLVRTADAQGNPVPAEVSLAVTDEAVHALATDRAGDILKYFYPRRPLRVETDFSFPEIYLSGGDKAGRNIQTREYFPDTAFWSATVVTDASGKAAVEFDMPDSLTTWRATARAGSLDSHFGQSLSKVVCSKPFLVRLEAPRFFTQKDEVVIGNIVHNRTAQTLAVNAGLDAPALEVGGELVQSARVGPGDIHRFEWHTSVPTAGEKQVRVWAEAGELSDAMRLTIPVVPKGRRRVEVRCGAVQQEQIERLEIRKDAIAGATSMQIRLTPSLAAGMLGALEYLAQYPYGCTEQTMSAFLPDVVIYQMLQSLGISVPRLEAELPKMVREGLLKLYDMQHDDGGWGWWRYDDAHPWMTAYVVFGLVQAQAAGFQINESVLEHGQRRLERMIADGMNGDNRAFVAYVLSQAGDADRAGDMLEKLLSRRRGQEAASLSNWSQALVVLTLHELGRSQEARSVLAALKDGAETGEGICYWAGTGAWSDVETTAMVLKATCAVTPHDRQLGDMVRWLMLKRQGGHWYSTRDTAFILYALADYLQITRELETELSAVAEVNGQRLLARRFTSADACKPEVVIEVPPELLTGSEATLELAVAGTGRLYYTAELSQYIPAELGTETVTGQGLVVERSYRKLNGARPGPASDSLSVASGDIIEVTLKLSADREFKYLILEDPIPAGCEVADQGRMPIWEWDYWWADKIVRDELVAFAITHLPAGTKQLRYKLIAQIPGQYSAMPTQIYNMYDPSVRTSGKVAVINIQP